MALLFLLALADPLQAAVDLPTAEERRAAADALADTPLDTLLAAARVIPDFRPAEPGPVHERLPDGDVTAYVPRGYDPARAHGLLMIFHWTGGRGRDAYAGWRGLADELGLLLVAPSDSGPNEGYTFSRREREAALAALRWARRRFHVDANRVYATGVSRGGHLSWDLALRYRDRFAAIAPMIGSPRVNVAAGQNNLRFLPSVVDLPIRDLQGSRDDPRMIFNLRLAFRRLEAMGAKDARLFEFPELGHAYDASVVDWREFFSTTRDPAPREVVATWAGGDGGRAFWAEIVDTTRDVTETFALRVDAEKWARMDDGEKKVFMQEQADRRTAVLTARRTGPGTFEITARGVARARLLFSEAMLPGDGPVRIRWNGRTLLRRPQRSSAVLARDFVERFDPTFLPVAEAYVP